MSEGLEQVASFSGASGLGAAEVTATLRGLMGDPDAQWSAGTFGAIAEFLRDHGEEARVILEARALSAATSRGAVAIAAHRDLRLVAYETISRSAGIWRHAIALCLPEGVCAMNRRRVVTELGPDGAAVREADRSGILFDLGLGLSQTDACVRTSDAALIGALRASAGKDLFAADNPVLMDILRASPHRVFVTPVARVEVFQPIPPPHGKSPLGPHTHILPKLLRANRTHAATSPIPVGLVPCAHVYPAHAVLDAEGLPRPYDEARQIAFDALLAKYGVPELVAVQHQVMQRVAAGAAPDSLRLPADKFARTSVRVTLRKLKASGLTSPALAAWIAHFDRSSDEDGEDETQHAS